MDTRKKATVSSTVTRITRPKLIGVVVAVAIPLMLILAFSCAASAQEIRFTGTVNGTNPPEQVGDLWWNVSVDAISSGPQTSCEDLTVKLIIVPPMGGIESITIGDRAEVYGNYTSNCTVSLNGEKYYIRKSIPQPRPTRMPTGLLAFFLVALAAIVALTIALMRRYVTDSLRKSIYTLGMLILAIVLLSFTLTAFRPNCTSRVLSVMLILVGLASFFGFIGLGVHEKDQELSKEDIRLAIGVSLITFYITLVGTVSMFSGTIPWPEITETMITHFTTIIGVAIAFYFTTEAYLAATKMKADAEKESNNNTVDPAVKPK